MNEQIYEQKEIPGLVLRSVSQWILTKSEVRLQASEAQREDVSLLPSDNASLVIRKPGWKRRMGIEAEG